MQMEYFIAVEGKQKGPMTLKEVIGLKPSPDTLVWHTGLVDWKPLSELKEFASVKGTGVKPEGGIISQGERVEAQDKDISEANTPEVKAGRTKSPWAAIVSLCFAPIAILFIIITIVVTSENYDYNLNSYYLSSSGYKASWLECISWPLFIFSLVCTIISDTFTFLYLLGGRTKRVLKVSTLALSAIFTLFIIIYPLL